MNDSHKRFHQIIIAAFLIGVFILVFGQDIRGGFAQLNPPPDNNISQPPTQTTQPPAQQPLPPPPQYQVQDVPPSFKPTAIPPGNNVAAPLNTGSETQTKAGALNVGSLNAGTINSGSVAASGNLNITGNLTVTGTLNLQGHNIRIASVPSTPIYRTSYGSWAQGSSQPDDTCNGDSTNSYTCVPGITQSSCRDKISYQGGAHNSFTFYQQRSVSCWTEYNMINTLVVE